MNESQLKSAEELYQNWSTTQLVRATTVEKNDYEPEALAIMAQELGRRGTMSESERESVEIEVFKQAEEEKKRLSGLKGFLLLFVVLMLLGSGLHFLSGVSLLGAGDSLLVLFGVIILLLGGYGFFVSALLIRKRADAPKLAQQFIILDFGLDLAFKLVVWQLTDELPLGVFYAFRIIFTLVGLGYLSWSRRVANTYGQPKYEDESLREYTRIHKMLPENVICASCNAELELEETERQEYKFQCPECSEFVDLSDLKQDSLKE